MARDFGSGPSRPMSVTFTSLMVVIGLLILASVIAGLFNRPASKKSRPMYTCNSGIQINHGNDSLCADKQNISKVNHMVQFEDGSWCDFLNGRCENNGPGDLILNSVLYKGK